jgi:hypothetical protein
MSLLRTAASSRKGRILIGVVGLIGLWQAWLSLSAPGKISEDVTTDATRVDVVVTLSFPPERFHVEHFQRVGRVSRTEGPTVEVRGVRPDNLRTLARPFWVRRVEPLERGG